jgi:cell division protein FtsB
MNVKDLQATYTMRDMVNVLRRVDELTRTKTALTAQLATAHAELAQAKTEIADLTAQVYDMQADLVREMTAPQILTTLPRMEA